MTDTLGRLERVPLRAAWQSEAADFTPWLAQPENIQLLGETLGLELEVEAQEKNVGPFRADILCKDTATGSWVLIENQLERTDHTHLGQLITYAAGLEAVVIVWVAERFTDEHRAALDWLNELGSERLRCFGLEIELWRIASSPMAPKFNVVSQPNDWTRSVAGNLTDTQRLRLEYWTAFAQYLGDHPGRLRPTKPSWQHWMGFALGRTGVSLEAIASTYNSEARDYSAGEIRAQVLINHPQYAKRIYAALEAQRDAIEAELGEKLVWHNPEATTGCRIYFRRGADIHAQDTWAEQHRWLGEKLEALHRAFSERVQALNYGAREEGEESGA